MSGADPVATPRGLTIVLHGEDIAVAAVIVDLTGSFRGQRFSGTFRYARTWRRSAGAWRIIAGAVVPIRSS